MPHSAATNTLFGWCNSRRNTATRRRNKSDMQADNNILLFGQWFRNKQSSSSHASTQPAADAALKTPQARPPSSSLCPRVRSAAFFNFLIFLIRCCCQRCFQRRRRCLQLAILFIYLLVLPTLDPAHMTAQARSAGSLSPGC